MGRCQIVEMNEREFDMKIEFFKREQELKSQVEIAEVFGRMKEQVLIATNLIELGSLEPQIIAEVTGLSISHIEAMGSN
ncbi:hypothetical protein [Clostridium beijerinckii]|uniref:hypothetical protein n=1 Tax=Clostridium beijerinckii TaxID=1520 RepID=UPI0013612136|nr:hypothetical protein [Clostridium beijerinckii]MZK49032.1 hypothetical protein [Clostridium beijerinckii]MZK57407.1 hypothetical protein [Clostridium beijerinckii]MZK67618.1 hypothetical protein [Clostridium beijerinckii]MZK72703.1 hypothetical protein [Clostridium beijerinckii]MZK82299.1 hypothetical protein [Clostridium beijerinckii]